MRIKLVFLLAIGLAAHALATEPLVGTWTLSSQTEDGRKVDNEPLTLRVYPVGDGLEFAFSVPVNGIHLVSMKFTSVHLDGSAGSVENVRGTKIGTVKITRVSRLEYKAVIEGPNRPKALNKMTVSNDGQTLTSESDTAGGNTRGNTGPSHAVQVFSRQ